MKRISKIWIGVIAVAIIAVAVWMLSGIKKERQISFETDKVKKTDIQNSITATGTIEPVTSVTVGTQVSGIVSKLFVDYNSVVKKGQIIAELDKTNLTSELNTAKANLSSAQSTLAYETANYKRYKTLFDKGLVSADDYENAELSYLKAKRGRSHIKRNGTESTDQSRLCHNNIANRRCCIVEIGRRRPDCGCQFQHSRTVQHSPRPDRHASGS